jgi:hypothetical protein
LGNWVRQIRLFQNHVCEIWLCENQVFPDPVFQTWFSKSAFIKSPLLNPVCYVLLCQIAFSKCTFTRTAFAESGFGNFGSPNPSSESSNFSTSNVTPPVYVPASSQPTLPLWETTNRVFLYYFLISALRTRLPSFGFGNVACFYASHPSSVRFYIPFFSFSSVSLISFYIFFACFFLLIFYFLCFFLLSDLQLLFMLVNSYLIPFLPMVFHHTLNPPLTSFVSLSFSYSLLLNVKIKRSLTKVGNFHYTGFLVVKQPLACKIMNVVRRSYV